MQKKNTKHVKNTKHTKHKQKKGRQAKHFMDKMASSLEHCTDNQGGDCKRYYKHKQREDKKVEGLFHATAQGFGFATVEGLSVDIFIPARCTGGAIDEDRVLLSYRKGFGEGRFEGNVLDILERKNKTLIGTLLSLREKGVRGGRRFVLAPDHKKIPEYIPVGDTMDAKIGDKVEVLLEKPKRGYALFGDVCRVFGESGTKGANYEAILAENGIAVDFSAEALEEAKAFAAEAVVMQGRVRPSLPVFTIDGEDAKDLDDAISLKKLVDGFELSVAIADVSVYVKEHSALDKAVLERGTSVYFADKVVPMLPKALSNGACSLHAGEDKYALTAIMRLSKDGEICDTKIEKQVICSSVRGVYSEVNDLLDKGEKSVFVDKYTPVLPMLKDMHELYTVLLKRSRLRGGLELDAPEASILLDTAGMPTEIIRRKRGDAERMIEQFMLCANEGVATLLCLHEIPCVYRVHEEPPEDKLKDFFAYLQSVGLEGLENYNQHSKKDIKATTKKITAKDFSKILEEAKEKGLTSAVIHPLLRTMAKAKYEEFPKGHFGLGIPRYCHFTSPIRRLSDLATHRIIHAVLLNGESPKKYARYAQRASLSATNTELSAMRAERAMDDLYKCLYLSRFIGEEFIATVVSITRFGIFAMLENTCEGMIALSSMPFGYIFDEKTLSLYRGTKDKIRLGDLLKIGVESCDLDAGRVAFSYISQVKEGEGTQYQTLKT